MKLGHHLNQYINIYLHRGECCKTSFIYCFIVTAKNLIWHVFFFLIFCSWWSAEKYLFAVLLTCIITWSTMEPEKMKSLPEAKTEIQLPKNCKNFIFALFGGLFYNFINNFTEDLCMKMMWGQLDFFLVISIANSAFFR